MSLINLSKHIRMAVGMSGLLGDCDLISFRDREFFREQYFECQSCYSLLYRDRDGTSDREVAREKFLTRQAQHTRRTIPSACHWASRWRPHVRDRGRKGKFVRFHFALVNATEPDGGHSSKWETCVAFAPATANVFKGLPAIVIVQYLEIVKCRSFARSSSLLITFATLSRLWPDPPANNPMPVA